MVAAGGAAAAWLVLALAVTRGAAQTTSAVCGVDFDWMKNSRGQTPCTVAAFLGQQCFQTEFTIPALPSNKVYINDPANECNCNPVYFSLIQACALCQSGATSTFDRWLAPCPANASSAVYPRPVSNATAIPPYAALPIGQDGNFDAGAALRLVDPARANSGNSSSSGLPIYATALIVVFSIIVLIAAIAAGFYCYRRRKQRQERVLVTDASGGRPRHYYAHLEPPPRPRGLAGIFKLAPKKVESYNRAMSFDLNTARTSGSLDGKYHTRTSSNTSLGSGRISGGASGSGFLSNLGPSNFGPFTRVKQVTHTAPRSTFGLDQDDETAIPDEQSPVGPDMESYMLGNMRGDVGAEAFDTPNRPRPPTVGLQDLGRASTPQPPFPRTSPTAVPAASPTPPAIGPPTPPAGPSPDRGTPDAPRGDRVAPGLSTSQAPATATVAAPVFAPLRPNRLDLVGNHIPAVGGGVGRAPLPPPPPQQPASHSPSPASALSSYPQQAQQMAVLITPLPPPLSHPGLPDPNAPLPQPGAIPPQFAEQSKLFPAAVRAAGYVGVPFEESPREDNGFR